MSTTTSTDTVFEPLLQKYATPLLSLVVVMVTAITAALSEPVTDTVIWQLVALFAGSVVTFFVPLLDNAWAGGLKTGAAILAAIATAVVPFLLNGGHLTGPEILTVVLAAFKALATEIGVQIRTEPQAVTYNAQGVPSLTSVAPPVVPLKASNIPSFDSIISSPIQFTSPTAKAPVQTVEPILPPAEPVVPEVEPADVPSLTLPEDVPTASDPTPTDTSSIPVVVPESTDAVYPTPDISIPVPTTVDAAGNDAAVPETEPVAGPVSGLLAS